MKKQQLFLVSFFIICTLFVNAQEYTFGIKAGINHNSIGKLYHYGLSSGGGVNANPNVDTYYSADKKAGTQFGIFGNIAFKKLFIRPELVFSSLKNSYPLALKTSNWTSSTIEIPILLGYEIYKPISVYVGPAFSSIKNMNLEGTESTIIYKKSALNLNTGILVNFNRFGIDLRYSYGLKPVEEQEINIYAQTYGTNRGRLLKYTQSQIVISLHLNLININGYESRRRVKKGWRPNKCTN